jgi:hypothetical protein
MQTVTLDPIDPAEKRRLSRSWQVLIIRSVGSRQAARDEKYINAWARDVPLVNRE